MNEISNPRWVSWGYPKGSRDLQEVLPREPEAEKDDYGRSPCSTSRRTRSEHCRFEARIQTIRYSSRVQSFGISTPKENKGGRRKDHLETNDYFRNYAMFSLV